MSHRAIFKYLVNLDVVNDNYMLRTFYSGDIDIDDSAHDYFLKSESNSLTPGEEVLINEQCARYVGFIAEHPVFRFSSARDESQCFALINSQPLGCVLNEGVSLKECIGWIPGTLVNTPQGYRPAEDLAVGDEVTLINGATSKIFRVIYQVVDSITAAFFDLLPVKIKEHTFSPNVPFKELTLSPNQFIFMDGHLVRASALVNGHSITQTPINNTVKYFHLELDSGTFIKCDGLCVESFIGYPPYNIDDKDKENSKFLENKMYVPRVKFSRQRYRSFENEFSNDCK